MEFLAGSDGPIIPDPDALVDAEHLAQTQSALEFARGHAERVAYFKQRVMATGRSGRDIVITLINVDDSNGKVLADALMPGHDWQGYRDAGAIPVARGLAQKNGVGQFLEKAGFHVAAEELMGTDELRAVVLCSEVALILDVESL